MFMHQSKAGVYSMSTSELTSLARRRRPSSLLRCPVTTIKLPCFCVHVTAASSELDLLYLLERTIERAATNTSGSVTYTITCILKCITESTTLLMKRVYRTTMRNEATNESLTVVCKVALGRSYSAKIRAEGRMHHDHLQSLQGSFVPFIYGLYAGYSYYDGEAAVLVMEDCGVSVDRGPYSIVEFPFKYFR